MGRSFVGILLLLAGCGAQDFPPPPGRCSPGQSGACPEGYICCSDDPAALDLNALDAAALPNCKAFVMGVPQDVLDDEGLTTQDLERACLRRLGAADARGFCLGKSPSVTACPLDDPSYRDPCEQRNDEQQRAGCG